MAGSQRMEENVDDIQGPHAGVRPFGVGAGAAHTRAGSGIRPQSRRDDGGIANSGHRLRRTTQDARRRRVDRGRARDRRVGGQSRERLRVLHGGEFHFRPDAERGGERRRFGARRGPCLPIPSSGPLYQFARSLVQKKGHVAEDETQALLDAGYSSSALLEVVAQVGHTTMASLAHGIGKAPVDAAFAPQKWNAAVAAV